MPMLMSATMMIQSACTDVPAFLAVALFLGAFDEQLDGDPDDHGAADQLDILHVEQLGDHEGAGDSDDDRRRRSRG